jgi:general stress protein YciG
MKGRYNVLEVPKKREKKPHAVELGRKGGKARLTKMTPEQRREIARKAIAARWARTKN